VNVFAGEANRVDSQGDPCGDRHGCNQRALLVEAQRQTVPPQRLPSMA